MNVASWAQGRRWNAFISVFFATALVGLIALLAGQTPVAAVAGVIFLVEGHVLMYLRWQRRTDGTVDIAIAERTVARHWAHC